MYETDRVTLRKFTLKDIDEFEKLNSSIEVMKYFPKVLTRGESLEFLERIIEKYDEQGFGLMACIEKKSGNFMGYIGLNSPNFNSFFTPTVEIGWRFKSEYWHKGYATEGASEIVKIGFVQLKLSEITSFTSIYNLPSQNVMKRLKMIKIAKFEHPNIEKESWLASHVLYRITFSEFNK